RAGRSRSDAMTSYWDVVVVGAGVIGSAVGYFLAGGGRRVCVVERAAVAAGTSSASARPHSVQGPVPGPAPHPPLAHLPLLANVRRRDRLRRELESAFECVRAGGLVLAEDETEYGLLREFAARQVAHLPVEFWEADDVRRAEPYLNPRRILGATYCPLDGYA